MLGYTLPCVCAFENIRRVQVANAVLANKGHFDFGLTHEKRREAPPRSAALTVPIFPLTLKRQVG